MLRTFLKIFSLIIIIYGCNSKKENLSISSKYENIITKYTKIHALASTEVVDTFYILIRLPKSYNVSTEKYPVLYLLDGDISFDMAMSTVRYLQFGDDIPEMILVAPAYGTMLSDREMNYRERDYTPSVNQQFENSGGAENYLRFLTNELVPYIDSSYRTNDKRILNGYSLGGLFSIYTLLNENKYFKNFIVGSPYLSNDLAYVKNIIKENEIGLSGKKLFISVGELEDFEEFHKPINEIIELLGSQNGVEFKYKIFEEGTHFTCPSEALVYGLKFIFN